MSHDDDAPMRCIAAVEDCYCSLPEGHDGFHVCALDRCGGEWKVRADGHLYVGKFPGGFPGTLDGMFDALEHYIGEPR